MRYLSLNEVLHIHQHLLARFGGVTGIRDMGALEPALAQPRMAFAGQELYPTIVDQAAALESRS